MADLFDYIAWRGDLSFDQSPFNEIDGLIFAQLSYVLLDGVVSENFKDKKTFHQLAEDFKNLPDYKDRFNIGYLINGRTTEFLFKCAETKRFKDVEICGFRNIFSEKNVEQFAAVSYFIDKKIVIGYRGTDDTFIGYEEDFNIGYMDQIPAQRDALDYFEEIGNEYPFADFILVGHSKGGNLAVNTAVKSSARLRRKIISIYNYDGPGFNIDFFKTPEYKEIEGRLHSFYPQLSIVGMLFHHPKNFEIIESSNFAIMQHDAMSWQVQGNGFVNKEDFAEESKIFYTTFNNWVDKVTLSERKDFINSLFFLIKSSGCKCNLEVEKNPIQASAKVIAAYTKMDKFKKESFKDMFALFINTGKKELPFFKMLNSTGALKR